MTLVEKMMVRLLASGRRTRMFASITAPQLIQLVNDLDRRVYRTFVPSMPKISDTDACVGGAPAPNLPNYHCDKPKTFGDLSAIADKNQALMPKKMCKENDDAETEKDHHLRLSRTGRNHDPNWYLGRIHHLCLIGNTQEALRVLFVQMLTKDRVMPDRNLIHVLLSGLADVGDSDSAFKVYRKMTELGIPATNSSFSRLFKSCAEEIATWQRQHRYDLSSHYNYTQTTNTLSALPCTSDLSFFAGPGLGRAQKLWRRLHERGFRLNRVAYNSLLFALARGGDLRSCFQALDAMLGLGGLPPPLVSPNSFSRVETASQSLPTFRPDKFTLTALLTAVQQACKTGVITSALEATRLGMQIWHLLLPRLRNRPSQHHFTLLLGIISLPDLQHKQQKLSLISSIRLGQIQNHGTLSLSVSPFFELKPGQLPNLIPNRLDEVTCTTNQRLITAKQTAEVLLKTASQGIDINKDLSRPPMLSVGRAAVTTDDLNATEPSSGNPSITPLEINWLDEDLFLQSPVNLLLPLPKDGVRINLPRTLAASCAKNFQWQKLALLGGLNGFLDCMSTEFKVSVSAPQLFTRLAGLLPVPSADQDNLDRLDRWETAFLNAMDRHNVPLDMPVFNMLVKRRADANCPIRFLMATGLRRGLTPDEFTWSCLARTCRNAASVKTFLANYSKTAVAISRAATETNENTVTEVMEIPNIQTNVRPSLHTYATLLAVTEFNWEAKIVILRSMLGRPLTKTTAKIDTKAAVSAATPVYPEALKPNRRMITNLELEIARYRDLAAREILPKDNSSMPACDATGGVIIPPFSQRAFKKFIAVYKMWATVSSVEHETTEN